MVEEYWVPKAICIDIPRKQMIGPAESKPEAQLNWKRQFPKTWTPIIETTTITTPMNKLPTTLMIRWSRDFRRSSSTATILDCPVRRSCCVPPYTRFSRHRYKPTTTANLLHSNCSWKRSAGPGYCRKRQVRLCTRVKGQNWRNRFNVHG